MRAGISPDDEDKINSLAIVLPLAVAGFALAAACWSLFAVAGVYLRQTLAVDGVVFGFLLSIPMATGALLAIPAGLAAQKFGARRVMLLCLAGLAGCMVLLITADSLAGFLVAGAGLGLAGGYYSAGLQFVIRHSPARHTGLVLGLFGAGITGVGISYHLVPLILDAFSWAMVPVAYLIMLLLLLALVLMLTEPEDAEGSASTEASLRVIVARLARLRVWQMAVWFGVVAGSFFSLALWLPDYLAGQYQLPVQTGAGLAQWFVIPGALAQVLGGWLADRFGSSRVVSRSLMACLLSLFVLSYPPMTLLIQGVDQTIHVNFRMPLPVEGGLIVVLGVALGCSMAALQRTMVTENREATAIVAGLLLVSACSVAFLLPVVFAAVNQWVGVRSAVFMILFLLLATTLILFARDARRQERQTLLHPGI
ncbi:MFS transporter [Marinobacter zhanjiangensis]|uniref:Nitrate/nitrite transporter n=1 Tax=Marinobacter zhanjiangensis TaxID=578215 RepID=A0ABQ3B8H1_9GAMM|nr:MFS transporter [Marinobacter zhanjiangensis]GGY78580.1 nitrate/nitrite transporter [Marinobacter zhanjiangensis]